MKLFELLKKLFLSSSAHIGWNKKILPNLPNYTYCCPLWDQMNAHAILRIWLRGLRRKEKKRERKREYDIKWEGSAKREGGWKDLMCAAACKFLAIQSQTSQKPQHPMVFTSFSALSTEKYTSKSKLVILLDFSLEIIVMMRMMIYVEMYGLCKTTNMSYFSGRNFIQNFVELIKFRVHGGSTNRGFWRIYERCLWKLDLIWKYCATIVVQHIWWGITSRHGFSGIYGHSYMMRFFFSHSQSLHIKAFHIHTKTEIYKVLCIAH